MQLTFGKLRRIAKSGNAPHGLNELAQHFELVREVLVLKVFNICPNSSHKQPLFLERCSLTWEALGNSNLLADGLRTTLLIPAVGDGDVDKSGYFIETERSPELPRMYRSNYAQGSPL